MLYQIYETQRSFMEPFADLAHTAAKLFSNSSTMAGQAPMAQRVAAGYDLFHRLGKDYLKPEFGIRTVDVDGVDVATEAVGYPATFDICQQIVRPGGHIANVGVHGKPVDLQLQKLWIRNITLTTGLVNTNTTPMLLKTVMSGKIDPNQLITHHFKLDHVLKAYGVFGNAGKEKAMKVIISP